MIGTLVSTGRTTAVDLEIYYEQAFFHIILHV